MRVLTTNLAASATLLDAAGNPLSAATGYAAASLVAGRLDKPWKAPAAAFTHAIVLDLGSAKSVNCAALFDLYATQFASPTVTVSSGAAATGPWTQHASLTNGGRRDWGAGFDAVSARFWRFDVAPAPLSYQTQPEIALLALGSATDLRRGEASRDMEAVAQVVVNGSQATKGGEEYLKLSLRWATLTATDHAEMLSVKRAMGGGLTPAAIWPDAGSPGAVYWGRVAPGMKWSESVPVYTGHAWEFVEMERVLRG